MYAVVSIYGAGIHIVLSFTHKYSSSETFHIFSPQFSCAWSKLQGLVGVRLYCQTDPGWYPLKGIYYHLLEPEKKKNLKYEAEMIRDNFLKQN